MPAQDLYDDYYTEKIWAMVPEVYRTEDALGPQPNVLRQIVEVLAGQAAVTRRSIDRLWEDQSIENCDDWAVPYIGDLVGTRLLPEADSRARRVDVGRTVHFRRRRGTPSVLEELVRELSGWDVVLVEAFRRLARTPHRLDTFPPELGRVTRTPLAGTADLRSPRTSDLVSTPFDEFFRTPDLRLLAGKSGRIGLGNFNLHVFRLRPFEVNGVDPVELQESPNSPALATFTFDPSGRDIPLFSRGEVVSSSSGRRCISAQEWQVAREIPCRLLSDATFVVSPADAATAIESFANSPTEQEALRRALATISGFRFATEARLRQRIEALLGATVDSTEPWYRQLLRDAMALDSGRRNLYDRSLEVLPDRDEPDDVVVFDAVMGADLSALDCHPDPSDDGVRLLIDPARGRFSLPGAATADPLVIRYFYGFSGDVGAGTYTRELTVDPATGDVATGGGPLTLPVSGPMVEGTLTIEDNRTYTLDLSDPIASLVLQANDQRRPYVRLLTSGGAPVVLSTDSDAPAKLTLDGLWLGSSEIGTDVLEIVIERTSASPDAEFDWDEIHIRNATLDPGGLRGDGQRIPTLRIVVRASVKLLKISHSIVGPIEVFTDLESPELSGVVETLEIIRSVVDATQIEVSPDQRPIAISNTMGDVRFEEVTVFGDIVAERVLGTDSIIMGRVVAADTQGSCLRFSVALPSPDDQYTPDRFHTQLIDILHHHFISLRLGDPGYAQLSTTAPEELKAGAEDGSELGAFSSLLREIRLNSVNAKVDEFKPVGILTQLIFEGEGTTAAP